MKARSYTSSAMIVLSVALVIGGIVYRKTVKNHNNLVIVASAMVTMSEAVRAYKNLHHMLPSTEKGGQHFWTSLQETLPKMPACPIRACSFVVVDKDPLGHPGPFLTMGVGLNAPLPFPTLSGKEARFVAERIGQNTSVYYLSKTGLWDTKDSGRYATIFVPLH